MAGLRGERASTPDDLLGGWPAGVRALADELRAAMLGAVPGLAEHAYPVWRGLGYRHPAAGYVCGLFPHAGGVKVFFERGLELADPDGVLAGGGRQVRFLDARVGEAAPLGVLSHLVRQAVAVRCAA